MDKETKNVLGGLAFSLFIFACACAISGDWARPDRLQLFFMMFGAFYVGVEMAKEGKR